MKNLSLKQKIIQDISLTPKGRVVYFGMLGKRAGVSGQVVGWILSGMKEKENCPWHRVVAKNGFISSKKLGYKGFLQEQLLLKENVEVVDSKVDMDKYMWTFENLSGLNL